jgi:hypothetical protein
MSSGHNRRASFNIHEMQHVHARVLSMNRTGLQPLAGRRN